MTEKNLIKKYLSDDYEQSYKIINEKYEYLSVFYEKFAKVKNILEKFFENNSELFKIKKDSFSMDVKENDYNDILLSIKEEINKSIKDNLTVINDVLNNLTFILDLIKTNKNNYNEYLNLQNTFNTKLIEYENSKTKYLASAEKAELFTYEFIEKQVNENLNEISDKKDKLQNIAKEEKEKYLKKYSDLNDIFAIFIEKQKIIFEINKNIKISFYEKYVNSLFSLFQYTSEGEKGSGKKEKIKNIIMKFTEKKEALEKIEYKEIPKIELTEYETKIIMEDKYNLHEISIYMMVCEEMSKMIGNYAEDIIQQYLKKVEINERIKRIINSVEKVSKKDEQYIKDILQTETGQHLFIINFNQLRTNGQLLKTKTLIEFFERMINIILEKEKISHDFKLVKSCIILSQTFYYEEKDKKVYLYNYINNHKWLKTPDFWRDIINLMIINEAKKITEENNEQVKKASFDNIAFSQILSYTTSMRDFLIDQRIILKIIDELLKKYVISKEYIELIYNNVGDKKFVEKLREEYQSDPDLEKKILDKINFEQSIEENNKEKDNHNENKIISEIDFEDQKTNDKNKEEIKENEKNDERENLDSNINNGNNIITGKENNNKAENINNIIINENNKIIEKEEIKDNNIDNIANENKEIMSQIIEKEDNVEKVNDVKLEKDNQIIKKEVNIKDGKEKDNKKIIEYQEKKEKNIIVIMVIYYMKENI